MAEKFATLDLSAAARLANDQLAPLVSKYKEVIHYMHDFLAFDKRTFIHSMAVASVTQATHTSLMRSLPELPVLDTDNKAALHYGAVLHDIGKAGVETDLSSSSRSLYPEEDQTTYPPLFTPDYHAPKIADKHEMIGAQMIHLLFSELSMHKKVRERTVTLIENHHKKPDDYISFNPDKTYETLPKMGSTQTLLHILLVASDIATAMSESRGYHTNGKPRTQYQIYTELENELTPHLIQAMFDKQTLDETQTEMVKESIIQAAMKSAFDIQHITSTNDHDFKNFIVGGNQVKKNEDDGAHLLALTTQARRALGMSTSLTV